VTITEKKKRLAQYRLTQARESIDEATYLFRGGKSSRSVINRVYYSMFYAILALLVFEPFSSSKHSGVISYFNRRFIKTGEFPREIGRVVNKAFDLRQRGDYREEVEITSEQVEPFIKWGTKFLTEVEKYLRDKGHI